MNILIEVQKTSSVKRSAVSVQPSPYFHQFDFENQILSCKWVIGIY
jgi:hypothetical protein